MKCTATFDEGYAPTGKSAPVQLNTGYLRRLIHPDAEVKSTNVAIAILTMKPGDSVALHYHVNREECYFIVSGEGVAQHVEDRGKGKAEEIKYVKNLSIHIPPGTAHDIKVVGNEPLKILVIMAPPLPIDDNTRV